MVKCVNSFNTCKFVFTRKGSCFSEAEVEVERVQKEGSKVGEIKGNIEDIVVFLNTYNLVKLL